MDRLSVPGVLLAAFLAAMGTVFYSPAASTLMIDIIPHDDMVRGQSVFQGTVSAINMVGTAFSGAMVAFFGVPLIVVINGLSNLYSAATEIFVRVPRTVQQGNSVTLKSVISDSVSAAKSIFSDGCMKIFVPCALIINLLAAGPLALILPFCMEKGFSVDQYGYLIAVYSLSSLIAVLLLGAIKLGPRARFWVMSLGFSLGVPFVVATYFSNNFLLTCIFAFLAGFLNCAGNVVFNASMMLALPEENRSAILGFIESASIGGTALSTLIYGFLGDIFPLYLVFSIGSAISLIPMIYMSFHPRIKKFVIG
jgi:MFS family permease